ncbi:hypothetical protein OAI07_01275 [Akkermansiaceae bacterium]|nr:hypothetical protein [Akkermansiaceae bacterium]
MTQKKPLLQEERFFKGSLVNEHLKRRDSSASSRTNEKTADGVNFQGNTAISSVNREGLSKEIRRI